MTKHNKNDSSKQNNKNKEKHSEEKKEIQKHEKMIFQELAKDSPNCMIAKESYDKIKTLKEEMKKEIKEKKK